MGYLVAILGMLIVISIPDVWKYGVGLYDYLKFVIGLSFIVTGITIVYRSYGWL